MITTVTMWVLVMNLGFRDAITVPGIATEAGCNALGDKFKAEFTISNPRIQCFAYQAAK